MARKAWRGWGPVSGKDVGSCPLRFPFASIAAGCLRTRGLFRRDLVRARAARRLAARRTYPRPVLAFWPNWPSPAARQLQRPHSRGRTADRAYITEPIGCGHSETRRNAHRFALDSPDLIELRLDVCKVDRPDPEREDHRGGKDSQGEDKRPQHPGLRWKSRTPQCPLDTFMRPIEALRHEAWWGVLLTVR